jgi:hypothetical protein
MAAETYSNAGVNYSSPNDLLPPIRARQIIVQADSEYPAAQAQADHRADQEGRNIPSWIVAAFTVVIAFAGVAAARIAALQWHALRDQVRHLKEGFDADIAAQKVRAEETERSLEIANRNADAAHKSAEAAIGAERAWLLLTIDSDNLEEAILQRIDPIGGPPLPDEKPIHPGVRFHFDNRGRTPAFIREAAMQLVISVDVPETVIAKPLAPWWPEEIIIPAGGRYPLGEYKNGTPLERTTEIGRTFGDDQAKLFDTEKGDGPRFKFWFYGHILYTDVWNNLHTTRFCLASEVWSGWFMPREAMQFNQRT